MPRRSRNTQRKILPKTPASPPSHPSLFFSGSEIEPPIGESSQYSEEPIGEEEEELVSPEELTSPTQAMAEREAQEYFLLERDRWKLK